MPTLDLKQLLDNDIITISTYDWFKPLYEKELNDIKEIQEAAQLRKLNPFFTNDNDDGSDDSDDDDGLSTMTKTTMHNIEDVQSDIQFLTDTNSSGHGNKVWHASIATCRYLKNLLLIQHDDSDDDADNGTSQSQSLLPLPFHCLELGAGTALPSLFLSQLLLLLPTDTGTAGIQNKNVTIHITDAKEYRNIKQILMSIELQLLARKSKATVTATVDTESTDTTKCIISYRVSPHNWGETTDLLNMNLNKKKNELAETGDESALLISTSKSYSNKSNNNIYDLIIISDCIYNPQYHDVLLDSLVATLKLPTSEQVVEERCDGSASDGSNGNGVGNRSNGSGRAVISFSLHGNVDDSNIWSFIKTKIPSRTTNMKTKYHIPSFIIINIIIISILT